MRRVAYRTGYCQIRRVMPVPGSRSLVFGLIAFVFALTDPAVALAQQPNILLYIADDQDHTYYGFQEHPFAQTPNIDRLASEGVVFESGYSTSSVCVPALRSLLTGVEPQVYERLAEEIQETHGPLPLRRESQFVPFTLPRLLRQAGYASFAGGKMWEGTFGDAGFDAGTMVEPPTFYDVDGADEFGRESMQSLYDFIDTQSGPWFAWVAPKLPHTPHDAPEEFQGMYSGLGLGSQAEAYWENVSRSDARVGEVMDFLEQRGFDANTVVIYLADNGWVQHEEDITHNHIGYDYGKAGTHDRSVRTPIILRWPAEIRPGKTSKKMVDFMDVFATILDYGGAPGHACLEGQSFREVADNGKGKWKRKEQSFRNAAWRNPMEVVEANLEEPEPVPFFEEEVSLFLRRKNWAYTYVPGLGIHELYHLKRDPEYTLNFAPLKQRLVVKLRALALEHEARRNAKNCTLGP